MLYFCLCHLQFRCFREFPTLEANGAWESEAVKRGELESHLVTDQLEHLTVYTLRVKRSCKGRPQLVDKPHGQKHVPETWLINK